eukprot:scaffold7228_cov523-Prasinococcus_capsulatus_cf.AAC.7
MGIMVACSYYLLVHSDPAHRQAVQGFKARNMLCHLPALFLPLLLLQARDPASIHCYGEGVWSVHRLASDSRARSRLTLEVQMPMPLA